MDLESLHPSRTPRFDDEARQRFLMALREVPNVSRAARAAGVSPSTVYAARAEDEAFASAWHDALEEGVDRMEEEAHRRAFLGYPGRPVVSEGRVVREVTEYSDGLATLLLKAHRPGKYREQATVQASLTLDSEKAAERIAALLRLAEQRKGSGELDDIL